MKLGNYLHRVEKIDRLIQRKSTGTPSELAAIIGISESMLYNYLQFMRQSGAPIEYSKRRKTYFYRHKGNFSFGFKAQEQA
jgi:predicted DNA-binding transcriptional regulator YafY